MLISEMDDCVDPFGQADCEAEIGRLKFTGYKDIYFDQIPFNRAAIRRETYLIIGRRGSGKTALSNYFSFQKKIHDPLFIDVDEPKRYKQVLEKISTLSGVGGDESTTEAEEFWLYLIWCIVFSKTREFSSEIESACVPCAINESNSGYLNSVVNYITDTLIDRETNTNGSVVLSEEMDSESFTSAIKSVVKYAKKRNIIIAIDTLEKYNTSNAALMSAVAGLVQAAAKLNNQYSFAGIHIKVFVSGEIFPHLLEGPLSNTLKSVKHPVHMVWRARDLLRLIVWRFSRFLLQHELVDAVTMGSLNWDDPQEVRNMMWTPYFGKEIKNANGYTEDTFSYVVRHTQMRPRQLILMCNKISQCAIRDGSFPHFSRESIIAGVREGEEELTNEVFNSYSEVYPNAADIIQALHGLDRVFDGSELDRCAPDTANHWGYPSYSSSAFIKLLLELGIIGKVVRDSTEGHYEVEFQYAQKSRIFITNKHKCAIHPMFFSILDVGSPKKKLIIHPSQFKNEEPWMFGS